MIKIVSSDEMRLLDKMTIESLGIPGMVLMENAGRAVYSRIVKILQNDYEKSILILAGRGNNGGDAFVVGRHLYNKGYNLQIFFTGDRNKLSGDALENFLIAEKLGVPIKELSGEEELPLLNSEILQAHIIVDGLLGTGIKGAARGLTARVIECVNNSNRPVIAIDTPSGLDCSSGMVEGPCIKAMETVTFGLPKRGMFISPGRRYTGKLVIADISIPRTFWRDNDNFSTFLTTPDILKKHFPSRELDCHKGNCGKLLIIAGSPGYTGAAALASLASLKTGAGLVTLGIPAGINPILEAKVTEVMTRPLPETKEGTLSPEAFEYIQKMDFDALALGPGISLNSATSDFVINLVSSVTSPMVIDADGLSALSRNPGILLKAKAPVILTPHPGEMARLTSLDIKKIKREPLEIARDFARKWNVFIVLKFASTIIATPDGNIYVNPTGNPGMASGGSGDVLTGMIGSFLAQGVSPLYSCLLGTFLHGLAGDLASLEIEEEAMIAGDLIDYISPALKKLKEYFPGENFIKWIVEM